MEHLEVVCFFIIFFGVCRDSFCTPCGGHFNSSTGIIESPNYPNDYPANTVCEWVIEDPNKERIILNAERFHLEACCSCDWLEIKLGDSAASPLLGRYCNSSIPKNITSFGYQIYLKFRTDYSNQYTGFRISWGSATTGSGINGGHFYSSTGIITSPNYPAPYPINLERDWVIEAPEGHLVTLNVKNFSLEARYDHLEIRSHNTINDRTETSVAPILIGKYSGTNIPAKITSIGNKIFLHFKSDHSDSEEGFVIEWNSTTLACGGNLTRSRGMISTPNYPELYRTDIKCNWNIRVSAGSVIQLILVHLEFEGTENCRSDFVGIYDGINGHGNKLGTYCQSIYHPLYIETTSNVASILLHSVSASSRRVQIIYHTVLHNKLHGSNGVIESPNFPHKYPRRENCSWTIEAPIGNTLNLKFSMFDLDGGNASSCDIDYLKIAEGNGDVSNREIGKFCNSNPPPHMIVSTQRQFFLQFHSDNSAPRNGFRLEWDAIVHNTIPPPSRTCLLWNDPVTKRDDYTYTLGIGGHKLHTQEVTWNEARLTCEKEGGYLAIINSDVELNAITELFNSFQENTDNESQYPNLTSIGFHDLYREGQFVTIHGQSLGKTGFFQWEDGQPDNVEESENCGALSINGELNDVSCEANYPFICEIPMY